MKPFWKPEISWFIVLVQSFAIKKQFGRRRNHWPCSSLARYQVNYQELLISSSSVEGSTASSTNDLFWSRKTRHTHKNNRERSILGSATLSTFCSAEHDLLLLLHQRENVNTSLVALCNHNNICGYKGFFWIQKKYGRLLLGLHVIQLGSYIRTLPSLT